MENLIVVDTSVFISALISPHGSSREIIRHCLQGHYKPLISHALFSEYEDVSGRTRILKKCPLNETEIKDLFNAFYVNCLWVPVYYLWRPNLGDESDNFLIELAVAGNADHIITHNTGDFKNTELSFPGLKILTPDQLLKGE